MKLINVVNGPQDASAVILGCMRMPSLSVEKAADMIRTASEEGINFFDHATCYGDGEAETRFGAAFPLTGLKREDVIIQSKCGLHFDRKEFDWSREDILSSAESSLRRLKTDYLDVLLLHRPDLLFDPEEVAEAFDTLEKSGKVRFFGVSNDLFGFCTGFFGVFDGRFGVFAVCVGISVFSYFCCIRIGSEERFSVSDFLSEFFGTAAIGEAEEACNGTDDDRSAQNAFKGTGDGIHA